MPAIYFSKITVIESLKTNKTGRRLYEDLKLINIQKGRDIDTAYLEAKNKEEFIILLVFWRSPMPINSAVYFSIAEDTPKSSTPKYPIDVITNK